jgi:hypothetical protein
MTQGTATKPVRAGRAVEVRAEAEAAGTGRTLLAGGLRLVEEAKVAWAALTAAVADWAVAGSPCLSAVGDGKAAEKDGRVEGRAPGAGTVRTLRVPDAAIPGVVESSGSGVKVYRRELFRNWGHTVAQAPEYTFVPRTRVGVVNVVRFAARKGLRVRAAGARHSWNDVFGGSCPGEVLVSMMEIGAAVPLSDFGSPESNPQDCELNAIAVEDEEVVGADGVVRARVRVGAAATMEHFRSWALREDGGRWQWMLPSLPVLVEATSAGLTQMMCHGAGRRHGSVSDYVVEVEVVNCKGDIQVVRDPEALKAVAGGFGLLGVVLSQVFLVEPMKIARLFPRKVPTLLAVPPVEAGDVPAQGDFKVDHAPAELAAALDAFVVDCDAFYSEWIWFAFQEECWVNVWDVEDKFDGSRPPEYLSDFEIGLQSLQLAITHLFEVALLRLLPAEVQARLLAALAMNVLPAGELIRTGVPDALHFQRGIHELRVRNIELEIRIPRGADGKPNFSVCQKAWWSAVDAIYAQRRENKAPVRFGLEMRIIGNSNMTMSTQRGNECGTCSIEVLTNTLVREEEWSAFRDEISARWSAVTDPLTGETLRALPHWAKEWPSTIAGKPTAEHLQSQYADAAVEFKAQLGAAAAEGGYSLDDAFRMFGNRAILEVLGESLKSRSPVSR